MSGFGAEVGSGARRSVSSGTILVLVLGVLLLATAGCGDTARRDSTRRSVGIASLEMLNDSVSVALGRTDRVRLEAAVETDCAHANADARSECDLADETRWLIRDSTVARRYLSTRFRYGARDTAWAVYILEQTGRTWVVVTNETGEVADSTLLTVVPEE